MGRYLSQALITQDNIDLASTLTDYNNNE